MGIAVGMIGSRNYRNLDLIDLHVRAFSLRKDLRVVTGDAAGVDQRIKQACDRYGVECDVKLVKREDKERFGKAAYHMRNEEILKVIRKLMIYWDGISPGSGSMFHKAAERKIDFSIFYDKPVEEQTIPC